MRQRQFWLAAAAMGLFVTGPALAIVVVEEDFEDDSVALDSTFFTYDLDKNGERIPHPLFDGTFPERGLGFVSSQGLHVNNPPDPNNGGRPGRWLPNRYDVQALGFTGTNGEWFDAEPGNEFGEVNPDTNWQPAVVKDHRMMSINADGPPRPGNEGFLINHHQGDCTSLNPSGQFCNNPEHIGFSSYKLALDAYMQFTDADGTPIAATVDGNGGNPDVVRGRFDFVSTAGINAWGLSSDINQMVEDSAVVEGDIHGDGAPDHLPLTKWKVGFGKAFNPLFVPGTNPWGTRPIHPDIVSVSTWGQGNNLNFHQTYLAHEDLTGCGGSCSTPVNLDPDTDRCDSAGVSVEACTTTTSDPTFFRDGTIPGGSPHFRYQTMEFEYEIGTDFFTKLTLDGQDVVACESGPQSKDCDDPDTAEVPMAMIPLSRPADVMDGIFFAPGGPINGNSMFFDEICVTINQELDGACTFTRGEQPGPLLGDANGDDQVTGADLIAVQQNFGMTGDPPLAGDANGDGQVTGADLISVQQNFGKALAAPVPEPATIALLVGCLALCRRQRA